MMIIENTKPVALSLKGRLEYWQERVSANPHDADYTYQLRMVKKELERQEQTTCEDQMVPRPAESLFIPGKITDHQRHAITGTKWVTASEPEPARTYPKGASMMLYGTSVPIAVGMGIGALTSGLVLVSVFCILWGILALAALCSELNVVKDAVHNGRIQRTDVSGIARYDLNNGRLTNGLRLSLGDEHWGRLLEGLKSRDSELLPLVTTFCEAKTKLIEADDEAYKLFDSETTDENARVIDEIAEMMRNLNYRTAVEISELFARRDSIALETAKQAQAAAEHEAFVQAVQSTMDAKLAVGLKLQYVKDAYNL